MGILADKLGVSQSAVFEFAIRALAKAHGADKGE
jgi:hypothetical protein